MTCATFFGICFFQLLSLLLRIALVTSRFDWEPSFRLNIFLIIKDVKNLQCAYKLSSDGSYLVTFFHSAQLLNYLHWLPVRYCIMLHYTGFQLITESNSNCPLLYIALLQYINHLIWLVSCIFLTSPDNSDHLPHSSFLFPEQNWTWASVLSLLLHPSFGTNSQLH